MVRDMTHSLRGVRGEVVGLHRRVNLRLGGGGWVGGGGEKGRGGGGIVEGRGGGTGSKFSPSLISEVWPYTLTISG